MSERPGVKQHYITPNDVQTQQLIFFNNRFSFCQRRALF